MAEDVADVAEDAVVECVGVRDEARLMRLAEELECDITVLLLATDFEDAEDADTLGPLFVLLDVAEEKVANDFAVALEATLFETDTAIDADADDEGAMMGCDEDEVDVVEAL